MDQCGDSAASEDGSCPVLDDIDENYTVRDCSTVEANIFSDEVEEDFSIDEPIAVDPSAAENANGLDPYIGREFESEHATYIFYGEYARHVGFGIRKRFIRRSKLNNEVIGRTYVCSREGIKLSRKEVDHPRPTTRLDCKAMMKVKRYENGKWIIIKFVKEHNHELYPHSACIFESPLINTYNEAPKSAEIDVSKTILLATKRGRPKKVQSTEKNCRNLFENEQREPLSIGDAQTLYDYFMRAQVSNPRFFYAMELDEQQRMRNVFWADTKARVDYAHFGDVVTFDTTCLTNKYETKIVSFVGVNHHGQSVLLGCALVTDETKASFLWVFRTWLTVMQGGPPKAIITDHHRTINLAIAEAFPQTCHRICLGHVMRRVPEKLGKACTNNERFIYKFEKCVYDSLTVEEFERRWKKLVESNGLLDHEWIQTLFEDRNQWVPVYLKDIFFAGMSTSRQGESVKSFFDDYVNEKTSLKDFIDQIELALQRSYSAEEKADLETYRRTTSLITGSPYEAQMASVYTMDIFKKFQEEILLIPSCTAVRVREEGAEVNYVVKELRIKRNGLRGVIDYEVLFNGYETKVCCVCRSFEFKGYLCRHAMVVLFAVGVFDIPSRYILKRWTWDAKNIDICNGSQDSGPEFVAKCFSDLRADSLKLAEESSLTKERYRTAKIFLKEALMKVASMEKVPVSDPNTKSKEAQRITWQQN
ncbi:hypothetical protein AQUCO_00100371v1 [Aquilegia coerulea]|uniref:Protein FAR1-RELATED SEQUENCE n=1 Tax=Aquilegia coerulea TaxID=218851 RepID=A0A2G5FA70_AQUCA|nr:hypothetical protein AQUCO_00100371v1 [Aquilegia coerulea]PIA64855.1 hypothetical protein AQUCO_00100371v1 [Aquilegia coerulea]PIA64856.1 hypothetical protein AQUCO_00100371v1 [Aquilegia coerulea]PIA64857.1 hypothetical protein AQUCO_00100371v1 [Aquilegia coerulea]